MRKKLLSKCLGIIVTVSLVLSYFVVVDVPIFADEIKSFSNFPLSDDGKVLASFSKLNKKLVIRGVGKISSDRWQKMILMQTGGDEPIWNPLPTYEVGYWGPFLKYTEKENVFDIKFLSSEKGGIKLCESYEAEVTGLDGEKSKYNIGLFTEFGGKIFFNDAVDLADDAKDLTAMFLWADRFNQPINFDTSNVTNMSYMFFGASKFNQSLNFNTSNVTNMSYMFNNAHSFNKTVNFNTSNVTDMSAMFAWAYSFNQPVNFDTSNVTDMSYMFNNAHSFKKPLNFDISNVIDMGFMFASEKDGKEFNVREIIFKDKKLKESRDIRKYFNSKYLMLPKYLEFNNLKGLRLPIPYEGVEYIVENIDTGELHSYRHENEEIIGLPDSWYYTFNKNKDYDYFGKNCNFYGVPTDNHYRIYVKDFEDELVFDKWDKIGNNEYDDFNNENSTLEEYALEKIKEEDKNDENNLENEDDDSLIIIKGVKDINIFTGDSIRYKKGIKVIVNKDKNAELNVDNLKVYDYTSKTYKVMYNAKIKKPAKLTIDNSKVLNHIPGIYSVTYTAEDERGNSATKTCNVIVKTRDVSDEINAKLADDILSKIIKNGMSDKQKLDAIYDWVHQNVGYVNTHAKDINKDAYNGFTHKGGDCYVYAATTKILLTRAGFSNISIEKDPSIEPKDHTHKWNLVKYNDQWYHFDPTRRRDVSKETRIMLYTDGQLREHTKRTNNSYIYDKSIYPKVVE